MTLKSNLAEKLYLLKKKNISHSKNSNKRCSLLPSQ